MDIQILHGPGNAAAKITMDPGEGLTTEAGAMLAMSGEMAIETTTHKRDGGGLLKAMKRMLAGESLFLNHFSSRNGQGELWLAATLPGDMLLHRLGGTTLVVQAGAFVCMEEGQCELDTSWQGFGKAVFSGESPFWLKLSGEGQVVINAFGAIYPVAVDGEYIVDTGHIVAFEEGLDFEITKAGGSWISSFLGGEGLVCKFKGTGTVWCQSHNPSGFGGALGPLLPSR